MKTLLLATLFCTQDPAAEELRPPHRCVGSFYSTDDVERFGNDVKLTSRSYRADEIQEIGGMLTQVRQAFEDLGLRRAGQLAARLRHSSNYLDPANCYANENALTMTMPCATFYLDGGPQTFDPVMSTLDVIADSAWSRVIRPQTEMPLALRDAISRLFANEALIALGIEGEWWPGKARPRSGSYRNLAPDHELVKTRDDILHQLEQYAERIGAEKIAAGEVEGEISPRRAGIMAVADIARVWTKRRYVGSRIYGEVEGLLRPEGDDSYQLIAPKTFDTRVPFEPTTHDARFAGLDADLKAGMKLSQWYGDRKLPPKTFRSVKNGDPTVFFPLPDQGVYRLSEAEFYVRRVGAFADEPFDIVLMDELGRETMRWSYLIRALPQADEAGNGGGWVTLNNTCFPYARPVFFVALEFPELKEDQDVEIGFWERDSADHSFWRQGSVFRSTEQPGDFALRVELNARQVPNVGEMRRLIRKLLNRANS